MTDASSIEPLFQEQADSWAAFLAGLKAAMNEAEAMPPIEVLVAYAQEALSQKIDEPAHSAKVKKAEIAALLLDGIAHHGSLAETEVLEVAFRLSGWTAGYAQIIKLGQTLLERRGRLDDADWAVLIKAWLDAGDYQAIRTLTQQHPDMVFDKPTRSRMSKALGALALADILTEFRAGRMPAPDLIATAYPEPAHSLVQAVFRALLAWRQAPNHPLTDLDLPMPDAAAGAEIETKPLFCGGFRWSGASAVYDFVKGLDSVGMPVRHPRIVSGGAAPLEDILDDVLKGEVVAPERVVDFILEKILGVPPSSDIPKAANVFRRSVVGGAKDPGKVQPGVAALWQALQHYAGADAREDKIEQARHKMRSFYALIGQSPVQSSYTAYDSVMRAWRPELVQTVDGARMIAIIRDPRDMYVTNLRMERPNLKAKTFIANFGALLAQYEAGLKLLGAHAAHFKIMRFEDFVLDAQARQSLCDWLGVANTADTTKGDFIPEQSARNIGVYKTHPDKKAIAAIEKAFPDWCYRPQTPHVAVSNASTPAVADLPAAARLPKVPATAAKTQLNVLSFSAMASQPMIEDVMSLSGKKGEPGWAVRKGITGTMVAKGDYDFVGFQHTQFDVDPQNCAAGQFLSEINDRATRQYEILNADARFGVKKGDSLPIYYDSTKWELVPDHYGVRWFRAADERNKRIGGGRFYVYGLFRQKSGTPGDPFEYVWVYNLRLVHKSSEELDQRRTRCLLQITRHMKKMQALHAAPLVTLADTNIKEPDAMANRLLNREPVTLEGQEYRAPIRLVDAFLALHPQYLNKISSQHNFKPAGKIKGTGRNDRILLSPDVKVQSCTVLTYNHDGNWPSYHFPIEAVLEVR